MIRYILTTFICSCAVAVLAQTGNSTDTIYIEQFEKQNNIQVNTWITDVNFTINPQLENKNFMIRLSPNVRNQIGVSFGLKKVTLFLGGQIPGTESNTGAFGKTNFIDFSFAYFKNRWGGEIYFRTFNGLYRSANDVTPRTIRSDARLTNYGFNLFYSFNKKFSYRSAISQQELQRKSSGSFVILGNIHYRSMVADSSIIPAPIDNFSNFGALTGLADIRFTTINFRPGYGHNFVFKNGLFFISPSLFGGIGLGAYEFRGSGGIHAGTNIDFEAHGKLSMGFNHKHWFGNIFMMGDRSFNVFDANLVSLQTISYGINLGYRLRSFFGIKWL